MRLHYASERQYSKHAEMYKSQQIVKNDNCVMHPRIASSPTQYEKSAQIGNTYKKNNWGKYQAL